MQTTLLRQLHQPLLSRFVPVIPSEVVASASQDVSSCIEPGVTTSSFSRHSLLRAFVVFSLGAGLASSDAAAAHAQAKIDAAQIDPSKVKALQLSAIGTASAPSPSTAAPAALQSAPNAASNAAAGAVTASATRSGIIINVDGRTIEADPAPVLQNGAVLVPLRGVLENLDAKVNYVPADNLIEVTQGDRLITLRVGRPSAIVNTQSVKLSAPPTLINNRAFVPLRSLAELFGYKVQWLGPARTVAINTDRDAPTIYTDHRTALKAGGVLGVTIDFTDATIEEAGRLLDLAKASGVGMIKTRFDWNTLEPTKGAAFDWSLYDRVVREARLRNLVVVGVLGNSARWASGLSNSNDPNEWLNNPPRSSELPSWENYVRRTVKRYRNDVHTWQVWENPAADRFRSVSRVYRIVVNVGAKAARQSDPKAIIHAAEPGGVNLGFIDELGRNGLTPQLDGIELYPTSQLQPGVPDDPNRFLLASATLRDKLAGGMKSTRDFWVGGLSFPVLDASANDPNSGFIFATKDDAVRERLQRTFTPAAQADYLVRAATLALAAGSEKVFLANLRDEARYERVEPINPEIGSGLLHRDFTPRPAYAALQTLARIVSDKPYAGSLALGPSAVALVFDNGREGDVAAWAIDGNATLVLNTSGVDPQKAGAVYVATRPDSQVLDSTGAVVGGAEGTFRLTNRPVWITKISLKATQAVQKDSNPVRLKPVPVTYDPSDGVSATFGPNGTEEGLYWRKYADFRGEAIKFQEADRNRIGLMTQMSRDIYNPAAGKPFIFFDVDDAYFFFGRGVPATVIVEVKRPLPQGQQLVTTTAGFNIQYDSPEGFKTTQWQTVEAGEGWATFTFEIPDASFSNRDGFDLMINTFGSKQDLVFGSVTVRRAANTTAATAGIAQPTQQNGG